MVEGVSIEGLGDHLLRPEKKPAAANDNEKENLSEAKKIEFLKWIRFSLFENAGINSQMPFRGWSHETRAAETDGKIGVHKFPPDHDKKYSDDDLWTITENSGPHGSYFSIDRKLKKDKESREIHIEIQDEQNPFFSFEETITDLETGEIKKMEPIQNNESAMREILKSTSVIPLPRIHIGNSLPDKMSFPAEQANESTNTGNKVKLRDYIFGPQTKITTLDNLKAKNNESDTVLRKSSQQIDSFDSFFLLSDLEKSMMISTEYEPETWQAADNDGDTLFREQSENELWVVTRHHGTHNRFQINDASIKKITRGTDGSLIFKEASLDFDSGTVNSILYFQDKDGKKKSIKYEVKSRADLNNEELYKRHRDKSPQEIFSELSFELMGLPKSDYHAKAKQLTRDQSIEKTEETGKVVSLSQFRKAKGNTVPIDEISEKDIESAGDNNEHGISTPDDGGNSEIEVKSPENVQYRAERSEISETISLQDATKLLIHINAAKAISYFDQPDMWRVGDEAGTTFVRDQSDNERWEVKINRRFDNGPNYEAIVKKMVLTADNGMIITEAAVNCDTHQATVRRYRLDEDGNEVPVPHAFDKTTPSKVFEDLSDEIINLSDIGKRQPAKQEQSTEDSAAQTENPGKVIKLAEVKKALGKSTPDHEENIEIDDELPENFDELSPRRVCIEALKLRKKIGKMFKTSKIKEFGIVTKASEIPGLPIGNASFNEQLMYYNPEGADQPAWAIDFNVVKGSTGVVIQPKSGEHIFFVINDNPVAPIMALIKYDPENIKKISFLRPELYNNMAAYNKINKLIDKMPQLSV